MFQFETDPKIKMFLAICVTKWHYMYNIENYVFDPKKCQKVEKTAFFGDHSLNTPSVTVFELICAYDVEKS